MAGRYRMVFLYGLVSESRFSGSRGFSDFSNDAKARVGKHSVLCSIWPPHNHR